MIHVPVDRYPFTRPICPFSRRILIPCGCVGDLVRMSFTIPSVSLPVRWSFFNTIETGIPGLISERLVPSMFLNVVMDQHFDTVFKEDFDFICLNC